jgi:hypothetical protein
MASESDWPTVRLWSNRSAKISFVQRGRMEATDALITGDPWGLARLHAAHRRALRLFTGHRKYEDGAAALRADDTSAYCPDAARDKEWPYLFYEVHPRNYPVPLIVLGSPPASARSNTTNNRPYPDAPAVLLALDSAIQAAMITVSGTNNYDEAIVEFRSIGRDPSDGDPFNEGRGRWLTDWTPAIPDWSEAGPRPLPGGLPGHGKRRR